ncbi:MAG: hypothetical protein JAY75_05330, partial [Candidatus Thiodiazotropha taylori]|nr:hypothetical protein [Candidatus Thiodiazotropha taylori]MCW4307629.1 hypothetical protein [Candidatus Thiodiazotropha endolucinida]
FFNFVNFRPFPTFSVKMTSNMAAPMDTHMQIAATRTTRSTRATNAQNTALPQNNIVQTTTQKNYTLIT